MANPCPRCAVDSIYRPHFSYSTLDGARAIRLLQLHAGHRADDIVCTIVNTSLSGSEEKQMEYTALSYVWGDQALSQPTISCNGSVFHVTSNLEAALKALRLEDEQRTLWVDQICINQADHKERCSQVQIMGQIYEQANKTIGWLGEPSEDTVVAIDFARELSETIEEISEEIKNETSAAQELLKWKVPILQAKGMFILFGLGADHPGWLSLRRMLEQPWFSRVWIIQEAMLSKHLTLQWGSEEISWEEVSELVANLEALDALKTKVFASTTTLCARTLILKIAEFQKEETVFLQDLLAMSTAHCSTDPRDRVYALLGLIKNSNRYNIVPSYDIHASLVFQSVTRTIIAEESSLRILAATHISPPDRRLKGLASWCPDWSMSERSLALRFMAGWSQFRADGATTVSASWDKDPATLSLRGRIVDTINNKRVFFDPPLSHVYGEDLDVAKGILLQAFHRLATLLRSCYQLIPSVNSENYSTSGTANKISLWRSLVGGLDAPGHIVTDNYSQYYQDYEKYVQYASTMSVWDDVEKIREGWSQERNEGLILYSRCVLEAGNERQFTITESGRPGWLPKWADTGDQIAILAGSRFPYVIRCCGKGKWIFIGPCYIDGIMLGEVMKQAEYKEEDITLC